MLFDQGALRLGVPLGEVVECPGKGKSDELFRHGPAVRSVLWGAMNRKRGKGWARHVACRPIEAPYHWVEDPVSLILVA